MIDTDGTPAPIHPSALLASAGSEAIRSYEDASTAVGRLDAAAKLASSGERELLVLRCAVTPIGATSKGMIALAQPNGEGDPALLAYARGMRDGAAKARGGVVPTVALLHALLALPRPSTDTAVVDDLLRDTHERTPPVLKAALVARALQSAPHAGTDGPFRAAPNAQLASLAVTLVLCVGGATTDAWLTLPPSPDSHLGQQRIGGTPRTPRTPGTPGTPGAPAGGLGSTFSTLSSTFAALAREARAAERALAVAREIAATDELRVRDALGRAAYSALDVLALMRAELVITVPRAARELSLTPPTAGAAVARLAELGIAREVTGRARSRAYAYEGLLVALAPDAGSG